MFKHGLFRLTPFRLFKICIFIAGLLTCSHINSIAQLIHQPGQPQTKAIVNGRRPAVQTQTPVSTNPNAQEKTNTAPPESSENSKVPAFNTEMLNLSSEKTFDFKRDWWKYTIMLVAVAISGYILTHIGTALLKFLTLVFCLVFSGASAYLFGPLLEPRIAKVFTSLPSDKCPPLAIAYFVIFLLAYVVAYLIVRLLRRPVELDENKHTSNQ